MVLILMQEASLGKASFWWPWLRVLPSAEAAGVPLLWNQKQLKGNSKRSAATCLSSN
jgi:hypothetical protein